MRYIRARPTQGPGPLSPDCPTQSSTRYAAPVVAHDLHREPNGSLFFPGAGRRAFGEAGIRTLPGLIVPHIHAREPHAGQAAGLSSAPLRERARDVVAYIHTHIAFRL